MASSLSESTALESKGLALAIAAIASMEPREANMMEGKERRLFAGRRTGVQDEYIKERMNTEFVKMKVNLPAGEAKYLQ